MVEEEQCYVESVGEDDADTPSTSYVYMLSTSFIYQLHLFQILRVCICKFPTCQMMIFDSLLL
jgi:hypothetical protein